MKKIYILYLAVIFTLIANFSTAQTEVTFYTTKGNFVVKMEDVKRPITTTNFLKLVKQKFYDGIIFHRVINNFMIQGGDPTGTGYGGSGVTIKDEFTPPVSNLQKTIAMANSGPNTGTSQFFINLVNNTYLDPKHPVFGTVISNFSVVQAIGVVPVNSNNKPLTPVVMDSVRVTLVATGVDEMIDKSLTMEIYPNPINDESIVSIYSNSHQPANVVIYNQLGGKVYSSVNNLSAGVNDISFKEVQMVAFPEGIYYIVVQTEDSISQDKFLLAR